MGITKRTLAWHNGKIKRSERLEATFTAKALCSTLESACILLAYDLQNAGAREYAHLDRVIPHLFGEKWVKKVLNTTWLIDTSLFPNEVLAELKEEFPDKSKVLATRVTRTATAHSGFVGSDASWFRE